MAVWVDPKIGTKVARMPGIQPHLESAARLIKARAVEAAAAHVDSGEYIRGIDMGTIPGKNGVTDREVYVEHPAAVAIEFGHVTRGKTPKFVRGQRIMLNAAYGQ